MVLTQLVRPLLAWLVLATITAAAETNSTSTTTTRHEVVHPPATKTSSSSSATHTIKVGPKSDPHQFSPAHIKADVGDLIIFEFYPTNHSVVKADYLAPCVPASEGLFSSGAFENFNLENGQLVGPAPTWTLRVNNTDPTFFYCTAIDSCLKNGMVGAINPTSNQSWQTQYQKALTYPYMLVPGQPIPAEGSGSSSTDNSNINNSPAHETHSKSSGLSKGAIAGVAVAAVVFVAILVALFFVLGRNRVYRQWMSSEDERTERTARWALFNHAEPYGNTKSEVGSNPPGPMMKPGHVDVTAVSSPDPAARTFSPSMEINSGPGSPSAHQGHWSWNEPAPNVRASAPVVPTELEAHPVIWEAPGSTPQHRY